MSLLLSHTCACSVVFFVAPNRATSSMHVLIYKTIGAKIQMTHAEVTQPSETEEDVQFKPGNPGLS